MRKSLLGAVALASWANAVFAASPAAPAWRWEMLPALPDRFGFAGMYAGVSGGALIAAGGANFSARPHTEGGKKVWHDRIFVLPALDASWREAGRLDRPSAYGVSATWRDAVVCAGGSDATTNFSTAWLMRWDGEKLTREALPDLPLPLNKANGAVVGDVFFVLGGQDTPEATHPVARMFSLDLSAAPDRRHWEERPWPANARGRFNAITGVLHGELFYFSGTALNLGNEKADNREFLTDAYAFRPGRGWRRLADLPESVAAGPASAIALPPSRLVVLSGITRRGEIGPARELMVYLVAQDRWEVLADETPGPNRLTVPLVPWRGRYAVINGEIAAGIRTPTVLSVAPAP
jgi:N-acetylneuraminic acid mutarotase